MRELNAAAPQKPALVSELGYAATGRDEVINRDVWQFHQGLWAAPFSGFAGSGMYWWWDTFIDPQDQWPQYGALADFFAGEDLASLSPGKAQVSNGAAQALTLQDDERALLWLYSEAYTVPAAQAAYDKAMFAALRSKQKLLEGQMKALDDQFNTVISKFGTDKKEPLDRIKRLNDEILDLNVRAAFLAAQAAARKMLEAPDRAGGGGHDFDAI